MSRKVILVEAISPVRLRVKNVLSENGFDVFEFKEGNKIFNAQKFDPSALKKGLLDIVKPDVFIICLELEDIDGIEVLSVIKNHVDYADIPVIVTSTHNDRETIISAINNGAADYVLKKENFIQTLLDKIKKIFDKEIMTFKTTLKREIDWVKYGKRELSFAILEVKYDKTGEAITDEQMSKVKNTMQMRMRHYDWIFQLTEKRLGVVLPITTLKDVVILRNRLLELLKILGEQMGVALDCQIGFGHYPVNAKTADELIALAEEQIK